VVVAGEHVRAAHEDGEPQIRSRLRTRAGVWLLMHGEVLEGTGQVALIIEPAKSSDVAPLIVEAYGLTTREVDVTRAIARGLSTAEVAAELHLSPHTVRDHVRRSSRRSASPAAASSCTGCSPSTTPRRRTSRAAYGLRERLRGRPA
jgi:DNA-binding CsgD family transcriptional regulator